MKALKHMLKKLFGKFLCRTGRHDWSPQSDNIQGEMDLITVVWYECDRCSASKLVCILSNNRATQIERNLKSKRNDAAQVDVCSIDSKTVHTGSSKQYNVQLKEQYAKGHCL